MCCVALVLAMAASTARNNSLHNRQRCSDKPVLQDREIIRPSIIELTKEARTNILCTVEGCGKILPNTPALNMHLVKSHRVQEGLVNPTVRKDNKDAQKLFCCPVEGCPRGPNRPFSQFSLVKQHFMKMHAEKKHKCVKCTNCYSTAWDLRRHAEDCGKTYSCSCGCPYASRAALLSHIYRTGHEVPTEHRYPPVKKRKMEILSSSSSSCLADEQTDGTDSKKVIEVVVPVPLSEGQNSTQNTKISRNSQKLLLPKPKMALVGVPIMHFTPLPVLLPSSERSLVLSLDAQGSVSTLHFLSSSVPATNNITPASVPDVTGVKRNKIEQSEKHKEIEEASVCSQTDISVSAQIQLPVSVRTQTQSRIKSSSSAAVQTDPFSSVTRETNFFSVNQQTQTTYEQENQESSGQETQTNIERETQTSTELQMEQEMCPALFDGLSVSTQTFRSVAESDTFSLVNQETQTNIKQEARRNSKSLIEQEMCSTLLDRCAAQTFRSAEGSGLLTCFGAQTEQSTVADNQTQTMILFRDLENILSDSASGSGLVSAHSGMDFDFEEFLNATHIQTQTEESGLNLNTELLDIETQTDFLLFENLSGGDSGARVQPNDLFHSQTQTDLNFLLDSGAHIPLGSILHQSSFSMSTESSESETQTDIRAAPLAASSSQDAHVRLNSAETQTSCSSDQSLGQLFLTSNETQTAVDDFLSWNLESHFSSVETQTCEELLSLFRHAETEKT